MPEETLEIQSELIFVDGMVHLPQEWNFITPTTFPSSATPLSSLTKRFFRLRDVTRSVYIRIKSLLRVTREDKAGTLIAIYS